jgi:hypothetical protein
MATVRFSRELRRNIVQKATTMLDHKVQAARDSFNKAHLDNIYDRIFATYMPHMSALPAEFFNSAKEADIYINGHNSPIRVQFGMGKPVPSKTMSNGRFRYTPHYSVPDIHLDTSCSEWDSLRTEHALYIKRIQTEKAKQNEFVQMVETVINAHETLSPALKIWPALWELVPEEVKNKHREVKEKRNRDKAELEGVDLSKLTAAVTVHKLRGG